MKGTQGLNALAALCGGAPQAKSDANNTNRQMDNTSVPTEARTGNSIASSRIEISSQGSGNNVANKPPNSSAHILNTQHPAASTLESFGAPNMANSNSSLSVPDMSQSLLQSMISAASTGMNPMFSMPNPQTMAQMSLQTPNDSGAASTAFNAIKQIAFYHFCQAQAQASAAVHAAQPTQRHSSEEKPFSTMMTAISHAAPSAQRQSNDGKSFGATNPFEIVDEMMAKASQSAGNGPQVQGINHAKTNIHDSARILNETKAENNTQSQHAQPSPSPVQNTRTMQPPTPVAPAIVQRKYRPRDRPIKSKPPPQSIIPNPIAKVAAETSTPASQQAADPMSMSSEDKKQLKRLANRRSAQLSRKRKKQFIEELREENDELRRKEQILSSIPDLIVAFDSSGKIWFVSESVVRFLDFCPQDLDGGSFWDRLCDESVRLLKAAFMDALAARKPEVDTAPLGDGLWELRLVDRDGKHKLVTLNGVVHFTGDVPECVCSIRPLHSETLHLLKHPTTAVSPSTPVHYPRLQNIVRPQQSVIGNASSHDSSIMMVKGKVVPNYPRRGNSRMPSQISDGESVFSENSSDAS